jgi:hypothetical protein
MSCISLPRIHFKGTFVTNVCTTNNDNADLKYANARLVTIDTGEMNDEEFSTWLRGAGSWNWNYFGDNSCNFDSVTVTTVELPDGAVLSTAAEDALIGSLVHLGPQRRDNTAIMVDVDPEGSFGTQIFSDEIRAQSGGNVLWKGTPGRLYSRWLKAQRNLGISGFTGMSAVWQAGIPLATVTFGGAASRGIDALRQAGTRGLLVRFCTYLIAPGIADSDLAASLQRGEQNPASGVVVGTIGPWVADDELATMPAGRRLDASAQLSTRHESYQLGPALAQVDRTRQVVSLDLITTFPEQDATRAKVNPGPVSLRLRPSGGGASKLIGPVPYDKDTYERTAGVVDVPYPPELELQLDKGELVLQLDNDGPTVLREVSFTVETDDRGVYLQQGKAATIEIRLAHKGRPPETALTVGVEEYVIGDGITPGVPATTAQQIVAVRDQVEIGSDGRGQLRLDPRAPGLCLIRFVPPGGQPGRFGRGLDFFTNLRVLPADDFSAVPDDEVTFRFLYDNVLRYYHLIYPAMNQFVDLSDEESVRASADRILERIAEDRWPHWDYMPRTRELSDGKRALFERWLRMQLA